MLSTRIAQIPPSMTFAIDTLASEMIKKGEPVLKFGIGAPDFDTPLHIKEAAIQAIQSGKTARYTPAGGLPELKQAIIGKFKRENNIEYNLDEVMAGAGGKEILYDICQVLIEPGDEVIMPAPTWLSHFEQVKLAGGVPVYARLPADLKLTAALVRAQITEKTKLVLINSPSNPTGAVMDPEEIRKIGELCEGNGIYLVSDEVYEHFIFGEIPFVSPASLSPEIKGITITVNAVSKTYAMTGWRLGYAGAPREIIQAMTTLQSHSTSNPSTPAQFAAIAALTGPQESVQTMKKAFQERRKFVIQAWQSLPDIECEEVEGAFYAFPKVSAYYKGEIKDSITFCQYLLNEAKVALVPGIAFLADEYVRFSYASSMEDIKEGMERIGEALKKIQNTKL